MRRDEDVLILGELARRRHGLVDHWQWGQGGVGLQITIHKPSRPLLNQPVK